METPEEMKTCISKANSQPKTHFINFLILICGVFYIQRKVKSMLRVVLSPGAQYSEHDARSLKNGNFNHVGYIFIKPLLSP
jgi:hypothetical protein